MNISKGNSNLIVSDSDYSYAPTKFMSYGSYLNEVINEYVRVMEYLLSEAIKDEAITENINEILYEVKMYPDIIENISGKISRELTDYIAKVDSADKYLY